MCSYGLCSCGRQAAAAYTIFIVVVLAVVVIAITQIHPRPGPGPRQFHKGLAGLFPNSHPRGRRPLTGELLPGGDLGSPPNNPFAIPQTKTSTVVEANPTAADELEPTNNPELYGANTPSYEKALKDQEKEMNKIDKDADNGDASEDRDGDIEPPKQVKMTPSFEEIEKGILSQDSRLAVEAKARVKAADEESENVEENVKTKSSEGIDSKQKQEKGNKPSNPKDTGAEKFVQDIENGETPKTEDVLEVGGIRNSANQDVQTRRHIQNIKNAQASLDDINRNIGLKFSANGLQNIKNLRVDEIEHLEKVVAIEEEATKAKIDKQLRDYNEKRDHSRNLGQQYNIAPKVETKHGPDMDEKLTNILNKNEF
ncbi:hypothetical protein H072_10418 [Dactylellina haptotyla CBS 200.50]|uniref:Uncharacterized protein n=1 Tax=Dactylellina haptotyla (strain CBS 200.50) TaxID=1284197 RepID=S8A093_DACHA|nr:hypothetical protein H072_10418 [Dactylellina haptotyla CBS 200.50]